MSSAVLKSERRREQNRRAQANLRRKREERIQDLQAQILALEARAEKRTGTVTATGVGTEQRGGQSGHHRQSLNRSFSQSQDQGVSVESGSSGEVLDYCMYDLCLYKDQLVDTGRVQDTSATTGSFQPSTADFTSHVIEEDLLLYDVSVSTYDPFPSYVQQLPTPSYPPSSAAKSPETPGFSRQAATKTPSSTGLTFQHRHCAFDALAQNAVLLGMCPESFLSTNSTSIFYSPLQSLATIGTSVAHLPPEFYPTMAQLSYPHQPWIDCIPLPELRSRIIFAVSHRPAFVNSLDIWHDVLSDGLSCAADPKDALLWTMSDNFAQRWQMLLRIDLGTLEAMCLASNPPLRRISLPGS